MRSKYALIATVLVALGFDVGRLSAAPGTVDSPSAPGATNSFTLEDIYNRLDTGAPEAQSTFTEPAAGPGTGTMHDLNEIMTQAPAIDNTDGAACAVDGAGGAGWPGGSGGCGGQEAQGLDSLYQELRQGLLAVSFARSPFGYCLGELHQCHCDPKAKQSPACKCKHGGDCFVAEFTLSLPKCSYSEASPHLHPLPKRGEGASSLSLAGRGLG